MATYSVNPDAVAHAERLIRSGQHVLDSDWGDAQPDAEAQNAYLERHSCVYRASEWRHKEVELAAHELLQLLDRTST